MRMEVLNILIKQKKIDLTCTGRGHSKVYGSHIPADMAPVDSFLSDPDPKVLKSTNCIYCLLDEFVDQDLHGRC
jgi:hypothetical protein